MEESTIGLIFAAIFVVSGLACFAPVGRFLWLARASARWPQAPGKILSSAIEFAEGGPDSASGFVPRIEYEYTVNDQVFRGRCIRFGAPSASSGKSKHQGIVERYPAGKIVAVLYDPNKPSRSVLEPAAWQFSVVGMALLGLLLTGTGVFTATVIIVRGE